MPTTIRVLQGALASHFDHRTHRKHGCGGWYPALYSVGPSYSIRFDDRPS